MSEYSIDYRNLSIWVAALGLVIGGVYYFQNSSSSSEGLKSLNINYDQNAAPGEVATATIKDSDTDEPVSEATVYVNDQETGTTNENGEIDFRVPEGDFELRVEDENYESSTAQISSNPDNDSSNNQNSGDNSDDNTNNNNNDDNGKNSDDSHNEESDNGETDNSNEAKSPTFRIGFTPPEVGQTNYIELLDANNEPIHGETVYLNEEELGQTDVNGRINFNVPNSQELNLETDTGLTTSASVNGYEAPTNETDDSNNDENTTETGQTGIFLDSDPVSNTNNRVILYENGERLSGETVYLDGTELGQTGSNGAIEFSVPLKNQITITTDHNLEEQTFEVQEEHSEPEITLLSPSSSDSFDTASGETTSIEFEASAEITENSGTAKLLIDGSELQSQDLSQGSNSISLTQDLSSGSYDWSMEVNTEEFNINSGTRSLTITDREIKEGLEIEGNLTVGEHKTIGLYQNNEPVQGEEIFVNGNSKGITDEFGEIEFEVPNSQEVTITTGSGIDEATKSVEGYQSESSYSFDTSQPLIRGFNYDLAVRRDGSSLSNAEVFVDGINIGSTDENGIVSFEVPLGESVELRVNDESEYSEVVDTSYVNFEIIRPQNEGLAQDYGGASSNIDINTEFEIESDLSGTYKVYLDGVEKLTGSLESGSHVISDTISTDGEGDSSLYIEYETDEGKIVQSYTSNFEVEWIDNPFTFDMISPVNQEQLDDYEVELNFDSTTNLERDYDIGVILDGKRISSDENLNGDYGSRTEFAAVDEGMHEWYIEVNDSGKDETLTSEVQEFETTVPMPVANATNYSPDDGATLQNNEVSADIRSYEDLDYSLIVDGSTYETKSLDSGEEGTYTFDVSDLNSGEHTWYIDINSRESSKTFKTEQWRFTVN